MFRYRIYPSRKQKIKIIDNFKACKTIYNELLEASINNYNETGKGLFKYDFNKLLTSKYQNIHSQVMQNVSDRVHKSFSNFFRRIKNKSKKKGFPRFKSSVKSITYPQSGFKFINERRLHVSKIGNVNIIIDRIPKGKVKTMTIKRNKAGQWFAVFSSEVETPKLIHSSNESVGIDVGLENFAALSNGKIIKNPRFLIKSENKLKKLHKKLSRKKKGAKNRFKSKLLLARQYVKVTNQRTDFLHKTSRDIANRYSLIAVEDLKINKMVKNHNLAKHITDASWNSFIQMLSYKAVDCGGQLIKVNPRNTSKTCSECGAIKEMPLSNRTFNCSNCSLVCNRDLNASINILKVGMDYAELNACEDTVRPLIKARVNEAGTIFRSD